MGPEMMQDLRDQAERFGTRFITDQATKVELATEPGGVHRVWVGDEEHQARAVILAMGAEHRKLGIPGEEELGGRGVSYCATCDAAFFKDAQTVIVGGGDSAMEEAIFLSKFADKVTIVHRRDEFRASKIMLERARETDNIEFLTPVRRRGVRGRRGRRAARRPACATPRAARSATLENVGTFIAIGHDPQSEIVAGQIELDENGYILTEGKSTRTNRPGVFAAGDVVDHTYRQAVTAAGSGCQAALDAEWYLRDTPAGAHARGHARGRSRRGPVGRAGEQAVARPHRVDPGSGRRMRGPLAQVDRVGDDPRALAAAPRQGRLDAVDARLLDVGSSLGAVRPARSARRRAGA